MLPVRELFTDTEPETALDDLQSGSMIGPAWYKLIRATMCPRHRTERLGLNP